MLGGAFVTFGEYVFLWNTLHERSSPISNTKSTKPAEQISKSTFETIGHEGGSEREPRDLLRFFRVTESE